MNIYKIEITRITYDGVRKLFFVENGKTPQEALERLSQREESEDENLKVYKSDIMVKDDMVAVRVIQLKENSDIPDLKTPCLCLILDELFEYFGERAK